MTMGHLWDIYGTSMGHLWDIYGTSMGHLWDIYGTSMGHLWDIYVRKVPITVPLLERHPITSIQQTNATST
jgi:hypothetical protein